MSKGSLAVIILAVLLVLSMVLGLTGAWFTSKVGDKKGGDEQTFGVVSISAEDAIGKGVWSNQFHQVGSENDAFVALPGSKYSITGGKITNTSNVDIYLYVEITDLTVTFNDKDAAEGNKKVLTAKDVQDATEHYLDDLVNLAPDTTLLGLKVEGKANLYLLGKNTTEVSLTDGSLTIAKLLDNKYQGGKVSVSYTVKIAAIQAANITADEALAQLNPAQAGN